jgi:hypothetical protein
MSKSLLALAPMEQVIIDALVFVSGAALLTAGIALIIAPFVVLFQWWRRRARHRRRRAREHDDGVAARS